jgi:hypothetical protein
VHEYFIQKVIILFLFNIYGIHIKMKYMVKNNFAYIHIHMDPDPLQPCSVDTCSIRMYINIIVITGTEGVKFKLF